MSDPVWCHLPNDVFFLHVLPHCEIDTRLAFRKENTRTVPLLWKPLHVTEGLKDIEQSVKNHVVNQRRRKYVKNQHEIQIPIKDTVKEYSIIYRYYEKKGSMGGVHTSINVEVQELGESEMITFTDDEVKIDFSGHPHHYVCRSNLPRRHLL